MLRGRSSRGIRLVTNYAGPPAASASRDDEPAACLVEHCLGLSGFMPAGATCHSSSRRGGVVNVVELLRRMASSTVFVTNCHRAAACRANPVLKFEEPGLRALESEISASSTSTLSGPRARFPAFVAMADAAAGAAVNSVSDKELKAFAQSKAQRNSALC